MSKDDSYWQGYIQKQNEAMEICKQCKYRKKAKKYDSLVKNIKDMIVELDKTYEDSKDENGESEYYYPNHTVETLQELLKEVEE